VAADGHRCEVCGKKFPSGARIDKKVCGETCRSRAKRAAKRAEAERLARMESQVSQAEDGRTSARRGPEFEAFVSDGWPERVEGGERSLSSVAAELGTSTANVSRWLKAWHEDRGTESRWAEWAEQGGAGDVSHLLEATPEAFAEFRRQTFTDEWGNAYQTPDFQMVWIAATLKAIKVGGRLVILSPPRHGKTQLLIHFCVWLILVRPNIRIMWIGGNEDIAKQSTGAVLDILENTPELADRFLGPGRTFKPGSRTGKSWSAERFTVATRVGAGIKSPTMVAVGKGGKLLSRDADLIVADDIIDVDSVKSPTTRTDDARWFNQSVSSRKEEHTAIMAIGSRQHHEDLWSGLLTNRAFTSIVEQAHDPACQVVTHKPAPINADEGHGPDCPECAAHVDCLLWPGKRTFAYLQDQRVAMDDDQQYEMIYLNRTRPAGEEYLTEADIAECKNKGRGLGLAGLPKDAGYRLVAGLDPATAGQQVAFLWAYYPATNRRFMVDLEVQRAGGLPGARRIIRDWHGAYGVTFWVIERNGYQEAVLQDRDITDFCAVNGVHLEPHYTHAFNKYDPMFGLTKQFQHFRDKLIDLPYGDEPSRDKVKLYERQLLQFEGPKTKTPTDILMASWFPDGVFRRWRTEEAAAVRVEYEQTDYDMPSLGDSYLYAATAS
jgi:hypothetical protein